MGTGLPSSSWNMYPLLMHFFPRDTIKNNIRFLISIPESVVDPTWIMWYLYPISPLDIPRKPLMMYDPTSPSSPHPEVKYFLVPCRSSNKISYPLNDPSIPITKAAHIMIYYSWFHPSWTWSHYSNTLSVSNRNGMLGIKLLVFTCPILDSVALYTLVFY